MAFVQNEKGTARANMKCAPEQIMPVGFISAAIGVAQCL